MGAKGEFQNRDRDEGSDLSGIPLSGSLGELPEDLANERGDLDSYSVRAGAAMSPDMASAARGRADALTTGLGSPFMDYTCRSVYDSRPPSGKDFNLWFHSAGTACGFDDFSGLARAWLVPRGYVAVIRKVRILLGTTSDAGIPYAGLFRVVINGSAVDPELMVLGQGSPNSVPVQLTGIPFRDGDEGAETFVIADENQTVGVDFPVALNTGVDVLPYVGFYGNFLLKTGRPAMFEPSNLAGSARSAVTTNAHDLGPVLSGSDVTARKRKKVPFLNVPILRG